MGFNIYFSLHSVESTVCYGMDQTTKSLPRKYKESSPGEIKLILDIKTLFLKVFLC